MKKTNEVIFKSKPNNLYSFIIIATCCLLCAMPVYYLITAKTYETKGIIMIVLFISISIFLLWIFFGIRYTLTSTKLKYVAGPTRGEIDIDTIYTIEQVTSNYIYSGLKIGSQKNGLIIKYNKFDDMYISPEFKKDFIKEILKINPSIIILNIK